MGVSQRDPGWVGNRQPEDGQFPALPLSPPRALGEVVRGREAWVALGEAEQPPGSGGMGRSGSPLRVFS